MEENETFVIVNAMIPGWRKTELFGHQDGFKERVAIRLIGRTGEEGGRALERASWTGMVTCGRYLSQCKVKPEAQFVRADLISASGKDLPVGYIGHW